MARADLFKGGISSGVSPGALRPVALLAACQLLHVQLDSLARGREGQSSSLIGAFKNAGKGGREGG